MKTDNEVLALLDKMAAKAYTSITNKDLTCIDDAISLLNKVKEIYTHANIKTFTDLKRLIKKEIDPRLQVRKVKYQSDDNNRTYYYYYFYSDDNELSQDLASIWLPTCENPLSVYVNHWQDQTVTAWLNDATNIMHSIYAKRMEKI